MNFRYPIFLDLAGKTCVVTGEGHEIAAKIGNLVDASAHVVYVNPQAEAKIEEMIALGLVRWEQRTFQPDDLTGCFLIITDSNQNAEIFRLAEEQRVLCNAVDDPAHCRFSFGSIHRQEDLTIAISTNGWAPALAVRLREWLEREVGPEYGVLLRLLKEIRPMVTTRIPDFTARRELWYRIVDSDVLSIIRRDGEAAAAQRIGQMVDEAIAG